VHHSQVLIVFAFKSGWKALSREAKSLVWKWGVSWGVSDICWPYPADACVKTGALEPGDGPPELSLLQEGGAQI